MSEQGDAPKGEDGPHHSDKELQQLVGMAMRNLDEAKRSAAEAAVHSTKGARVKRVGTVVLIVFSAAIWAGILAYWAHPLATRQEVPDEAAARETMAAIVAAETQFRQSFPHDLNGDGIPDFGKLYQLVDPSGVGAGPALVEPKLLTSEARGYIFTVVVRESSPNRPSGYKAIAAPLVASASAHVLLADDSGGIRLLDDTAGQKPHDVVAE